MSDSIPLILISGFLGAGKTTFLNNIINLFPEKKFGVIVNDFGTLGVDAAVIKNTGSSIINELNNGQIFCSCLSGSFINTVSGYADLDIDYLLVETSGLAKPSPLLDIMEGVKKINGDRFTYCGMITFVDASNYLKLSEVLNAVDEQIAYSDMVVLNKTDTVDAAELSKIEMKILSVKPDADIIKTVYSKIDARTFLSMNKKDVIPGPDNRYGGWGKQGRPVPILLKSSAPVSLNGLENFSKELSGKYLRMKGRLQTDEGAVFVDCTYNEVNIEKSRGAAGFEEEGLVVIVPADGESELQVKGQAKILFEQVE